MSSEVSCRLGYTEQHAVFALLHLAELGCALHFGQCVSGPLHHALVGGGAALNVAFHALLGGVCSSPTVSGLVHAHLATFPVVRLTGSHFVFNGLVSTAFAVHFINLRSEGAARMTKLALVSVLVLVNILVQSWWWTHDITEATVPSLYLPSAMLSLLSLSFIYSATKSRAVLLVFCTAPAILIAMSALNMAFPVDLSGRLLHQPESDYSDPNLHWAVNLRALLLGTLVVAPRAAASHARITSQPRSHASQMAPFAAERVFSLSNLGACQRRTLRTRVDLKTPKARRKHFASHAARFQQKPGGFQQKPDAT